MSAKGQDRLRADCSNKGSAGGSLNRLSASMHAVPTNGPTLTAFRFHVTNLWRRTLRRRSQKDWTTKERTARLANDWLPKPRILHPWPDARFAVRHPRWEPYARIGPVRFCAGGAR